MKILLQNNETWLVCGGRHFADQEMFDAIMLHLSSARGLPAKVVHGAASGADSMADAWAKKYAVDVVACPADWERLGKRAGPIRNGNMLMDHEPKLVIAFPGGAGTADMVNRAKNHVRKLDVIEVKPIKEVLDAAKVSDHQS